MKVVSNRSVVDEIIESEGVVAGLPRIVKVVEFTDRLTGRERWGLLEAGDDTYAYDKEPDAHVLWELRGEPKRKVYQRGACASCGKRRVLSASGTCSECAGRKEERRR